MTCAHEQFHAKVDVTRLTDSGGFTADVRIKCIQCNEPFQFLGLPPGSRHDGAAVSIDGQEARLAICPASVQPNPLQQMVHSTGKFDA